MQKGHDQGASARFVFRGTVIAPAVTTLRGEQGAATVRVDEVMEAPSILIAYNGRDVVVVPPARTVLKAGDTHVFHGGGYEFGQGLTVEAVLLEDVTAAPHVAARAAADPKAAANDRRMQQRLQQASVVVAGMVESVRLPRAGAVAAARTATNALASEPGPISEHDPQWREALVTVAQAHKGQPGPRQVVVRFAASDDVRWFKAPKFHPGQTGVFSLHSTEGEPPRPSVRAAAKALAAAKGTRVYCALDPADVQPLEREEDVARLLFAARAFSPKSARRTRATSPAKRRTSRRRAAGRRAKRVR